MLKKLLILIVVSLFSANTYAQNEEVPKYEVRGTWIATVINLDWPESATWSVSNKKKDLVQKLDALKAAGINLVFFQVRTEGDAFYNSSVEPWSKYLTGEEGKSPDPYWDPLEFAIEEAHKRGMELHAWLNPYRAMRTIPSDFTQKSTGDIDQSLADFQNRFYDANREFYKRDTDQRHSSHVANTHPEWLLVLNDKIAIFDPGLPEVMEYNTNIVMDVVTNYDVDGIHFDDYFYPYPPNQMGSNNNDSLDDSTFAKYPRGFTDKGAWRRNNVDLFVEMVHDSIQTVKPWVKFGISPFGIWKPGNPSGTTGLDAYNVIFADGVAWLEAKTIDYITPQLYWPFGGGQDYGLLATWWSNRAAENDRHIYPGHGLYRTDSNTFSNTLMKTNEIPRQVRFNRSKENITGSVFFRAKNISNYFSKGFADSLKQNLYTNAALQPIMAWKDTTAPESPSNLIVQRDTEKEYIFHLSWDAPQSEQLSKKLNADTLVKYAVYRVDSFVNPDETEEMNKGYQLVGLTGETTFTDNAPPSRDGYWYFVTAVSRNNVESIPTDSEEAGVVVSNEDDGLSSLPADYQLDQNYPNPFNPTTEISFSMPENGFASLKVYDMLGREVQTLINKRMSTGNHTVQFDASNLSSGVYLYRLETAGVQLTRKMTLLK